MRRPPTSTLVPYTTLFRSDPFGLTPRERQVLALVAAGATNREIGRQLYMAEKTASVHVSRILMKLDVRSRTEAARSEEHTSELQSRQYLLCRLLLEKYGTF